MQSNKKGHQSEQQLRYIQNIFPVHKLIATIIDVRAQTKHYIVISASSNYRSRDLPHCGAAFFHQNQSL